GFLNPLSAELKRRRYLRKVQISGGCQRFGCFSDLVALLGESCCTVFTFLQGNEAFMYSVTFCFFTKNF
ncbi:hypothetical protein CWB73_20940, partial [Pseudoalteromonas phenolica]